MDGETLREIIDSYDLVLVDTSFFGIKNNEQPLVNLLYDAKTPKELEELTPDLKLESIDFLLKINEFVRSDNVFILPGVQKELKDYHRILEQTHYWHTTGLTRFSSPKSENKRSNAERKNPKLKGKFIGKTRRTHNKAARFRKHKNDVKDPNYSSVVFRKALGYLNSLVLSSKRAVALPIYDGPYVQLPHLIGGISDTDYKLVEAAIGYSRANPDHSVEILSKDFHIERIINEVVPALRL
jgi:hypothetical protein